MKAMIPRFGVILLSLALTGCGLELLSPLKQLTGAAGSEGLQYSWPVDLALPLGELSLSLDDPEVARAIFGEMAVRPGQGERLHLFPATQELAPIRFAENLELKSPLTLELPAQAIPDVDASLPDFYFPDVSFGAQDLIGGTLLPGQPIPLNLTYAHDHALAIPPGHTTFTEARIGTPAGHLEFTVENRLGVRFSPTIKLYATRDGSVRELGRTQAALPLDPGQTRKMAIPLQPGSTLTRDLSLRLEAIVPGGQVVQGPVTSVALSDVVLFTKTISHMRVEIPTKSIEVAPLPVDLGLDDLEYEVQALRSLEVDEGVLELTLRNALPVAASVRLEFPRFFKPGQAEPMTASYDLKAAETRTIEIPLAGVIMRPDGGKISVTARATTKDTGPGGTLMALDGSQTLSGRVLLRAPLRFRAIEVPVTREISLPAASLPIQLPSLLTDQGVSLEDVVLRMDLQNESALAGHVALDVKATIPGKGELALTDKNGQPILLPIEPKHANELQVTAQTSNLLDLLNAMPSALTVAGKVVVDTKGQVVRLSAADKLEGKLSLEIPLSLRFPAFGGSAAKPAIEVRPATPLTFASQNRDHLNRVTRAILKLNIDNDWRVPLDLDLLFSATNDPFSDANAFVRTISLGGPSSGFRVTQDVTLEGESLTRFREATMLGMRVRSPGTPEAVSIFRGSRFRVNLAVEPKATLSSAQEKP